MKKKSIVLIVVCLFHVLYTKGQINIQQISSLEFVGFTSIQSFQVRPTDISSITQLGNYNSAKLSQTKEGDLFSFSNSSNSFQQGDFNLTDITQKGNENVLLSFQLGYLASSLYSMSNNDLVAPIQNKLSFTTTSNNLFSAGTNNILYSSQEGKSNEILAIQQGSDNYIEVEQSGNENFLIVQQVGTNNRVESFKQNSVYGAMGVISQVGDNNAINNLTESVNTNRSDYTQEGSNLSLTINNTLPSLDGIKVSQTGNDMNIVIDQSYFSFPMQ